MSQATRSRMPDALVLLFFVVLATYILSFFIPEGRFDVETIDGKTRIVADSFTYIASESTGLPLFAEKGEIGFLNFAFEGLVSGDKWGSAIGVIMFILITGGAFGIVMSTGSINRGLLAFVNATRHFQALFLPALFALFSLAGAVFGMGEEAIAFCLVLHPMFKQMGYSPAVTVFVTYVATQVGFATSWMNPFSVAIAQGIADLPLMSGSEFRIPMWVIFTLFGMLICWRLHKGKKPSDDDVKQLDQTFDHFDKILCSLFGIGLIWVIWGVIARSYYIPEIASQFFTIAIVLAAVSRIFGKQDLNQSADAFKHGAQQLLPAALIVGMAKGIILLLGGDDPTSPSTLNTILHWAGNLTSHMPASFSAVFMLLFQSIFNFFIASGSGQAALTMPLMAPLSDMMGLSRQIAVLAFQLGDGLTNIIIPTSASLIGCLGAVGMDWSEWLKFIWRIFLFFMLCAATTMLLAVFVGF